MSDARYLLDSSALANRHHQPVFDRLAPLLRRGLLATCDLLDLEAGYSARNLEEHDQILADRRATYVWVPQPENAFVEALDLQRSLSRNGMHRGVGIPDLLIAVTARMHSLTVLHYDHDFGLAASVAIVDQEWVVPRGSLALGDLGEGA